jgi:hypothetical protein
VHKRLWPLTRDTRDLEQAIFAYQKGFILQNDFFDGINFAYLLNVRSDSAEPADAVTDFVLANRVRRQVIIICENLLAQAAKLEEEAAAEPETEEECRMKQKEMEEHYWICATLWEAWEGLGDTAAAEQWQKRCAAVPSAGWMQKTTKYQIKKLKQLLAKKSPLQFLAA